MMGLVYSKKNRILDIFRGMKDDGESEPAVMRREAVLVVVGF